MKKMFSVVIALVLCLTLSITSFATVIDLSTVGGTKEYSLYGYPDIYGLMLDFTNKTALGEYNLADYKEVRVTYATDNNFTAFKEGMSFPAFFAICSADVSFDSHDTGFLNEDNILARVDAEDASITNSAGENWDKNERTAVIDLTDVDYNGNIWLCYYNTIASQCLVVGIEFVENDAPINVLTEQSVYRDTNFEYTINYSEVTITEYIGTATEVVIPGMIEGYPVTSIGDYAFANCSSLESILVSEDNTTYSAEDGVLFNKDKTELICCPEGKKGEYVVPNTVERIGRNSFYNCRLLTEIIISDGVTSIGNYAFAYCSSLTNITIPSSVAEMNYAAFWYCVSLENILVSEDNTTYSAENGVLFNKEKTELICCPEGKKGEYVVPNTVDRIGGNAFSNCELLTKIIISDGVTSIGDSAFAYCISLPSITIPSSVTEIHYGAFWYCSELNHVYYTGTKTGWNDILVGDNNEDLTDSIIHYEVVAGNEITVIEKDATCTIGTQTLHKCTYCDVVFDVEEEENSLGHNYETGLCTLCGLSEDFPLSYEFKNGKIEITGYKEDMTSVVVPDTIEGYPVTGIGSWAFEYCGSLTSITIPSSVTEINYSAFWYCSELNHVYYTGTKAEWDGIIVGGNNEDLTDAIIHYEVVPGNEITVIEKDATCTRVKIIHKCTYCDFIVSCEENENSLGHNYEKGICTRCGLSEDFPLSYEFKNGEIEITGCKENVISVIIPDTIEGYPVTSISDYAFRDCYSLLNIVIPESVMSIGRSAFYNCSSLTSITIPSSVREIGYSAFYNCSSLKSIIVSEDNTNYSAEDGVLFNKDKTKLICCPAGKQEAYIVPNTVEQIGEEAFFDCKLLTSITIPSSVREIGYSAFYNCSSLESIIVSGDNTTYSAEDGVLFNKDKTKLICCPAGKQGEYVLPDTVDQIGEEAFYNCRLLTKIIISEGVREIGYSAFYNCGSLKSIIIPNSLTSIDWCAFYDCPSLENIYYSGSEIEWNEINVADYGNDDLLNAMIYFGCLPGATIDIGTDFIAQIITDDNKQALGFSGVRGVLVQSDENNRGQMFYFVRQEDCSYKIFNVKTSYVLGWQGEAIDGTGINIVPNGLNSFTWIVQYESGKLVLKAVGTENLLLGISGEKVQLFEFTADDLPSVFTVNKLGDADYEVPTKSNNGVLSDAEISIINNSLCEVSDEYKDMDTAELNQKISEYASKSFDLGVNETKAIALCVNILFAGGEAELERVLAKTNDYSIDGIYAALLTDTGTQVGMYRVRNWEFYKSCVTAGI